MVIMTNWVWFNAKSHTPCWKNKIAQSYQKCFSSFLQIQNLLARNSTPTYLPKKNKNTFCYDGQHKLIPIVFITTRTLKYHIVNIQRTTYQKSRSMNY